MRNERTPTVLRHIAANVKRGRARRGITQEQLAEAAKIDVTFLVRIERAKTNISVDVLVALAEALDVRLVALLRVAKLAPVTRGRPRKQATK